MTKRNAAMKGAGILAALLAVGAAFVCLSTPISEPDFWWHLASGRSMTENRAFLERDPFTLDEDFGDDGGNASFILTYSWLSQLAAYLVFERFGIEGTVLLFALIHTATFACLFRLLRRSGIDLPLSFLFVALSFAVIVLEFHYNVPRPQAWSTLFAVVTVLLAEGARKGERWAECLLPPTMTLWANLHGGFVLGDLILALYAAGGAIARTASRRFLLLAGISILASAINPNGFRAALSFPILGPLATSFGLVSQEELKSVLDSIVENQSLLGHAGFAGILRRLPFLSVFAVLALGSFLPSLRNARKTRVDHLLLFAVLLLMGIRSIRYIVFFVSIGGYVAATNLQAFLDGLPASAFRRASARVLAGANLLLLLLLLPAGSAQAGKSAIATGRPYVSPYEDALRFMKEAGLRGNVFNDYNAGGPIIWALSPAVKVFVDGRAIHPVAMEIEQDVLGNPLDRPSGWDQPIYKMVFERYRIDFVLIPGCDPRTGALIKLAPALLEDPAWRLVYADDRALLFIRNRPPFGEVAARFGKPASLAYGNILAMADGPPGKGHSRGTAGWKLAKAVGFAGLGDVGAAGLWVDDYLRSFPHDRYALALKRKLGAAARY